MCISTARTRSTSRTGSAPTTLPGLTLRRSSSTATGRTTWRSAPSGCGRGTCGCPRTPPAVAPRRSARRCMPGRCGRRRRTGCRNRSVAVWSPPEGCRRRCTGQRATRGDPGRPADRTSKVGPGEPGRLVGATPICGGICPVPVVAADLTVFVAGAAVSLGASYVLVTRLERIGERLGLSEGLLGVLAALAGDAPEITSAVTALALGQAQVGAGVVIGSNVFNLAALLGLGAVVAGRIALHRNVILLGGVVGVWIAVVCLVMVLGLIPAGAALVAALAALIPYLIVLGASRARLARVPLPRRWAAWLAEAGSEEEAELEEVIHPAHGRGRDVAVACVMLVVVVAASVAMEQAATRLGTHFSIPPIIIGGVVLAAVTSLPNSVSAVYLAARGRGAAMFSTTLNSNALNVTAGLLVPATITGLGAPSGQANLIALWYLALTVIALAYAYRYSGMSRAAGALILGAYLVFVGSLLTVAHTVAPSPWWTVAPLVVVVAASGAGLAARRRRLR